MICKKCGEEKPKDEFHKNHQMKSGVLNTCKVCGNFGRVARQHSLDDDTLTFLYSQAACRCCGTTFKTLYDRNIHHTENGVQGIICCRCNRSLGQETETDLLKIKAAVSYMQADRAVICRVSELPARKQTPSRVDINLRHLKPIKDTKKKATHCACCEMELTEKFVHHVVDEVYGIVCRRCNMLLSDESPDQLDRLLACRDWIIRGQEFRLIHG